MAECTEQEDKRVVSLTEPEDVREFVSCYLRVAGYENTKINRSYVKALMGSYKGEQPVPHAALKGHIDELVKRQVKLDGD